MVVSSLYKSAHLGGFALTEAAWHAVWSLLATQGDSAPPI